MLATPSAQTSKTIRWNYTVRTSHQSPSPEGHDTSAPHSAAACAAHPVHTSQTQARACSGLLSPQGESLQSQTIWVNNCYQFPSASWHVPVINKAKLAVKFTWNKCRLIRDYKGKVWRIKHSNKEQPKSSFQILSASICTFLSFRQKVLCRLW